MSRRMPFGKFKGRPLHELPDSYIGWLRGLDDLREPLHSAVQAEYDRRRFTESPIDTPMALSAPLRQVAAEIVSRGFRAAARERHPDAGGSHEAMIQLTDARAALERFVGAA